MSKWNNIIDIDYQTPPAMVNVIVRTKSSGLNFYNSDCMIAHFIPKFMEEYHGEDDWFDYDESRDMNFVKEGWYANTTYIGDDVSSYFINKEIVEWKFIA